LIKINGSKHFDLLADLTSTGLNVLSATDTLEIRQLIQLAPAGRGSSTRSALAILSVWLATVTVQRRVSP